MDFKMIESIIKAVDNSSINVFEFELDGAKIKLQKIPDGSSNAQVADENPQRAKTMINVVEKTTDTPSAAAPLTKAAVINSANKYHEIKSPIVGAFYEAAIPGKPPFVRVGDHVKKGQTVCIIEAMKVMNEIESDVDGVIMEVLGSDGKMVEFGQVLFRIEAN